jgi:murein L,D-transpeptidase YcbB/YkuD
MNTALSHGCVRNLNENIAKMKKFIVKKIVRSEDLTGWLGSKQSMIFEMQEEDRFPVRIIYKTYDLKRDSYGGYIIFYKDVYNYGGGARLSKFDVPELIYPTLENI